MNRVRTGFGAGAIAGLALLGFAGSPAHALTYTFTSDHCSGAGGCLDGGTGGTVTVTETAANTLHFVIAPAAGFGIIGTGAGGGGRASGSALTGTRRSRSAI